MKVDLPAIDGWFTGENMTYQLRNMMFGEPINHCCGDLRFGKNGIYIYMDISHHIYSNQNFTNSYPLVN